MSTHYITRIVIERVDTPEPPASPPRTVVPVKAEPPKRRKTTLANIVVGAGDIEALKSKAQAHLQLVEDGGDIE